MIFIKFDEAQIVMGTENEIISLEDISKRPDLSEVIKNLYCPDENCDAKLTYNRRSVGAYLSKHKSYAHSLECQLYSEELKRQKDMTEYNEMPGRVSDLGIKRRKRGSSQLLRDFLNPQEKIASKPRKKKVTPKKVTDDSTVQKISIKVVYDSNGDVIKQDGEGKVREPRFYNIFPHQITSIDSWKNIATGALITKVTVRDADNPYAEIEASFEGQNVLFVLPEAFFRNNLRGLNVEQLIGYLKDIKGYIEDNPESLYIDTLCQSKEIDKNKLILYIPEPDFIGFLTSSNIKFSTLTDVAIAISTRKI
ncbi:hypothetical protein [Lactococcus lactis]|uniref:hypothetical protein n=1 Tax=Lactococcus lactis TaxID=1358 RepID=UPI003A802AA2